MSKSKTGVGAHKRSRGREPARPKSGGKNRTRIRLSETNTKILETGDLSDWDDEELIRGQRKDRNGRWTGRPPKMVPKLLHDELVRRTLERAQELMRSNLEAAVTVLTELALNPEVQPKDRLKAIEIVMDRVMGKAPERIELSATVKPWEQALAGGIVRDLELEEGVVDAEIVEED